MNEKQKKLRHEMILITSAASTYPATVDEADLEQLYNYALELLADPMPREELASKVEDVIYDAVDWNCDGDSGECRVDFDAALGAVRRVVNALLDGTEIK